ncbi:MAG: hypothetical protein Tsb009_31970 [Planctomycetaceae bacterium]
MILVEELTVQAGTFRLSNVSFEVPTGDYGILMGKTGSGKTTILESICGLKKVVSGRILLNEKNVTHRKPAERGIGFVPQDAALFPTMTVRQQLGFALQIRKWRKTAIESRVAELAALLEITHLLNRSVTGLSGGERQRIALGRALAPGPAVLCLDEPLSALDEETRTGMYNLLKAVQRKTGVTALHITHSLTEANKLGDISFVIQEGQVVEMESNHSLEGNSNSAHNGTDKTSRYRKSPKPKSVPEESISGTEPQ